MWLIASRWVSWTTYDAPAAVMTSSNTGADIDYGPRGPQHRDNAQLRPA